MIPQRSGNLPAAPNLIRRSIRSDPIPTPGIASRASAVNSTTDVSANGRSVMSARWNSHYLVPKKNTGPGQDDSIPIDAFANATPDWVFVTDQGPTVINVPNNSVVGRYAYAIYDLGGLVDMNVAGYPTGTTIFQYGRKGALAFADLTAPSPYPIPNGSGGDAYQVDKLVGWRNYATTQAINQFSRQQLCGKFPDRSYPGRCIFHFSNKQHYRFLAVERSEPFSVSVEQPYRSAVSCSARSWCVSSHHRVLFECASVSQHVLARGSRSALFYVLWRWGWCAAMESSHADGDKSQFSNLVCHSVIYTQRWDGG